MSNFGSKLRRCGLRLLAGGSIGVLSVLAAGLPIGQFAPVSATLTGGQLAADAPGWDLAPAAWAHGDESGADGNGSQTADPSLQQVVSDDEAIDLEQVVTIDHGHVDIGPKFIDGQWRLLARDDTATPPTWRELGNMVFYLPAASLQTLPEGDTYDFTGAKAGDQVYTIPQTEISGVPWLGWSTQSPQVVSDVQGQVQLTFEGHQGEGTFTNFLQAGLGGAPQILWSNTSSDAQTINVDTNTHTHTNWIFTEPGVHLVRVTASATLNDGSQVTDTQVLRFAVGDEKYIAEAQSAQWTLNQTAQEAKATTDAQSTATSNESKSLVWIIGGVLIVVGVLAGIAAALVLKRAKRERLQAYAASTKEPGVSSVGSGSQTQQNGDPR